jgi:hypothetical protein
MNVDRSGIEPARGNDQLVAIEVAGDVECQRFAYRESWIKILRKKVVILQEVCGVIPVALNVLQMKIRA